MGSPIVVTYATITGGASQIRGINNDIKSRLDDLKAKVAQVAESWDGDAHQQYLVRQGQWNSAQTELCALLDQIAAALEKTAQVYQDTEAANAKMWG